MAIYREEEEEEGWIEEINPWRLYGVFYAYVYIRVGFCFIVFGKKHNWSFFSHPINHLMREVLCKKKSFVLLKSETTVMIVSFFL